MSIRSDCGNGTCWFKQNDEFLDFWRVLKTALEPLLF